MKKFMKSCAITALILIVVGLGLALVGGSLKGTVMIRDVVDSVTGGRVNVDLTGLTNWGISVAEDMDELVEYELDEAMIFDEGFEIFTGDIEQDYAATEIREIDVEVGGCSFEITESPDENFHVEAAGTKRFQGYVNNQKLVIKGTVNTVLGNGFSGMIKLQVPADFTFDKVDMEIGAGLMDLGELSAEKLDLEVGAGQIIADKLTLDSLNLSVGMGEIRIDDMLVGKLDAEVGMGNLHAEGAVIEKLIAECAMGNIEMEIQGAQTDYDYSIECGMGNVTIGDNSYSGLANEKTIENGADRKMEVECAVGNVDIRFAE